MRIGVIFPGQGSQAIGMLAALGAAYPVVSDTFAEASKLLNLNLWQLAQEGAKETLDETCNTQPILLTTEVAIWRVWRERSGCEPALMAGHSLGEYSALVCAESIAFADAVTLVAERARLMQAAVPQGQGAMAAVLGLEDAQVQEICAKVAALGEIVEAVNMNAPGQVVIAGHTNAVAEAGKLAKAAGAKRILPLPVSVPSHCALMKPAAEQFSAHLANVNIKPPQIPIVHNASVTITQDPEQIRALLARQLYSPVRWVETIQAFAANEITALLEIGPGKVLTGLNKRIDTKMQVWPVFDPATLDRALQETAHAT